MLFQMKKGKRNKSYQSKSNQVAKNYLFKNTYDFQFVGYFLCLPFKPMSNLTNFSNSSIRLEIRLRLLFISVVLKVWVATQTRVEEGKKIGRAKLNQICQNKFLLDNSVPNFLHLQVLLSSL